MTEDVKPEVPAVAPPPEVPKADAKAVEPAQGKTLLGDTKVSEVAPEAEPKKEAEPAKAPESAKQVPEKYELKLPEGSLLDPARLEELSLEAKEKGYSNEEAQRDLETESKAVAYYAKRQNENYESVKAGWLKECANNPEFGGDKLEGNLKLAQEAINKYFPRTKQHLDVTGLGNHPDFFADLMNIGREMRPDTWVNPGSVAADDSRPTHQRVWGYMNEEKGKAT